MPRHLAMLHREGMRQWALQSNQPFIVPFCKIYSINSARHSNAFLSPNGCGTSSSWPTSPSHVWPAGRICQYLGRGPNLLRSLLGVGFHAGYPALGHSHSVASFGQILSAVYQSCTSIYIPSFISGPFDPFLAKLELIKQNSWQAPFLIVHWRPCALFCLSQRSYIPYPRDVGYCPLTFKYPPVSAMPRYVSCFHSHC